VCSKAFSPIHPPDALDTLPRSAYIGPIDPATVPRALNEPTAEEKRITKARATLPHPRSVLNLLEIEVRTITQVKGISRLNLFLQKLAKSMLSEPAWAYYRSGGDDEIS
jgi:L-lactate dehydrogenase (cytochrome)